MIKKTNRVLSLAMSAALMLTNMIAPMTVYAEDLTEAALEEYVPDEQMETVPEPETVVPEYLITLPWYEDITYMVDEGRIYRPENMLPEDKDILLKYKADEKVDFAFTPAEGITVTELHLRDDKKNETFFEVDEYGHVSFLMPDKDLDFSLAYEKYVPEVQAQEIADAVTEVPESEAASNETEQVPSYEETQAPAQENTDAAAEPGNPSWESQNIEAPETDEGNSNEESEQTQPDIELSAVIEDDGLPSQGSIMTVDTLSIPYGSVFIAAADYTNITYDKDADQIDLVSDEVDVNTPGTYSTIYRISHNNGEKMWYVLRPVLVMKMGEIRESETKGSAEASEQVTSDDEEASDAETEPPTEEVSEEETVSIGEEAMTEAITEAPEKISEDEIEAEMTETLTEAQSEELTEALTEESEDLSEEETEDLSEEETEEAEGRYKVNIVKGEELGIALDHEDGTYDAGETVTFTTDLPSGALTAVAALKEESNEKVDTADILYSEVTNEGNSTFTFEMPQEDVALEVAQDAALGTMLFAAAPSDDWDDNTDVEAGSYYYYSDGTLHPFSSVMGSGGNDSYKYVRYKVDGKTYTVYAYCMQHSMSSPPSGTTYKSMIELDEGGDDKYLRKAMFYGYGGPGWGDTFNGYNIQSIMQKYGCSSETRAMQHYLVDFLYDGESGFGGNLSSTAKNMLREIKAALAKMPDPTATQLTPSLSTKASGTATETFTWKANEAFTITIHLEDGVKLVNETTGKSGTGNVKVKGGEKFHLEATGDMSKLKGNYEITSNYPLDFHAMLLKLQSSQDIGFGYYTESKGLAMSVEWPDEGYVSVKKVAADGKSYNLGGCHIGIYSDAGATKLVHEFVTKADGSADAFKVTPGTYYVKEISVPEGWNVNTGITKITVAASNSSAALAAIASVSNSRATKQIEVQKKDAATGKTSAYNTSYSFAGMKVGIYADAALSSLVETLSTDAKGYAISSPLQYGTYYLREMSAPKGYDIYDHTFTVVLGSSVKVDGKAADKAYLLFEDQPRKKPVEVQKIDADTGKAEPFNDRYSFTGMEVTIYSDAACTLDNMK